MYPRIHATLHELEAQLAKAMNASTNPEEQQALERAHDTLVHQVAEWVRTAEARVYTT